MQEKLFAKNVYTGNEILKDQLITVENGKINAISHSAYSPEVKIVNNLAAGFFDSHINGGEKFYFTQKADEETIDDIYQASFQTGTAYVLPTLITSPQDNILKGIEAIKSYQKKILAQAFWECIWKAHF